MSSRSRGSSPLGSNARSAPLSPSCRRGLTPARVEADDALPVIRVPTGTPPITPEMVRRALDEDWASRPTESACPWFARRTVQWSQPKSTRTALRRCPADGSHLAKGARAPHGIRCLAIADHCDGLVCVLALSLSKPCANGGATIGIACRRESLPVLSVMLSGELATIR
jgi:hypothetical protein